MRHEAIEEAFASLAPGHPLHALRTKAMARFRKLGFPTTKQEEWRFTNVAPIAKGTFPFARPGGNGVGTEDVERLGLGGERAAQLVFVDGHYRADLSELQKDRKGLTVRSLADALGANDPFPTRHLGQYADHEQQPFVALNTAFLEDGAVLHLAPRTVVEAPIELLFVATDKACYPRILIVAEEGSSASIVESWVSLGESAHLTNVVTETVLGPDAHLDHYRLQCENERALHVACCQVHQARDSNYRSHSFTLGGALVRNDLNSALDAENVSCTLNGLFLTRGTQHVDNHTRLEHRKPHCESHELYKGILDDRSSGVFSGKIHVFEDAQKTDAKQSSANLLLSDEAVIDAKPQLEIYADDVRCTHGATIGQLDANALFYLRARGVSAEQAHGMLVRAFASEVTGGVRVVPARDRIENLLAARLPGGAVHGRAQ